MMMMMMMMMMRKRRRVMASQPFLTVKDSDCNISIPNSDSLLIYLFERVL
jgi:hypothetical protein